jgi:hypothetical protein
MKKVHWVTAGFIASATILYVLAQPWLAARSLDSALAAKDKEALRELVDFPLLKENLKQELPDYFRDHSTADKESTELATNMATMLGGSAMDESITPTGLIGFVNTGFGDENTAYSYDSLSRFTLRRQGKTGKPLTFVLHREGFHWRVTDIQGALDVLFVNEDSQSPPLASPETEVPSIKASIGEVSVLASSDTPMLNPEIELERERISIAAKAATAMHEKDEADRLAGKTFNESRIGWSFACDQSIHGISMLGSEKLEKLTYDEKSSVCSCVKDQVPDNIELLLNSPSRSLREQGDDVINSQSDAFGTCYFRVSNIKAQQAQMGVIRQEKDAQELLDQQEADHQTNTR